jgi:hypothetical protein
MTGSSTSQTRAPLPHSFLISDERLGTHGRTEAAVHSPDWNSSRE